MRIKIENPVYLTANEIEATYDGKWVYIANAQYTPYRGLLGGVPVVVADDIFEGQDDGFYDQFRVDEYAPRTDRDYIPREPMILTFSGFVGDET